MSAGFRGTDPDRIHESDRVSLIVETGDAEALKKAAANIVHPDDSLNEIGEGFFSAQAGQATLAGLAGSPYVGRLQTKKKAELHLNDVQIEIGLLSQDGTRVPEDGAGVLIGVIDSGFDLSHPAFRDGDGRLRVVRLLDQTNNDSEHDTAQLEQAWAAGTGPGADSNGHGTHVAGIAGGTSHLGHEGVAPGARFLLVKTDMLNTDDAMAWVFANAGTTPCVVNMSLGHHFGAHDGSDAEERLHNGLTGPGKIIVVSAGNERERNLHIGGLFYPGQVEEVAFDILRRPDGSPPFATVTLWHTEADDFDLALMTPFGQSLPLPAVGSADFYQSSLLEIEIGRRQYVWTNSVQIQATIVFKTNLAPQNALQNWRLRLTCNTASLGRLDGWFNNSGFATFRGHWLAEASRTVGLPATGDGCLSVASHVSQNAWQSDLGAQTDIQAVIARTSPFSSLGPTRDGRWKPDVSAPGQYVTAALADQSGLAGWDERATVNSRLVAIEGTSMAAPVVTGTVALMLQRNPTLQVGQIRDVFRATVRRDAHTGPAQWSPAYGYGKVDVPAALASL
jgi:subtilisin family serine protease